MRQLAEPARQRLESFFCPPSVAVVGATEDPSSVGRNIMANLGKTMFGGRVHPVNPGLKYVFGSRCYASVRDVPEHVDLAVIATPARTVVQIIGECVDAGVDAAIVISVGFKETGERGATLEQDLLREARKGAIRIIGPNCLGLMNPYTGLNATFAASMARPGHIGFISQSGALCTAILDWSQRELVGFSAFVSVGPMLDIGWGDLIQHLGDDPNTRSIVIYMESVGDARSFVSAAREVALSKPIIVLKPGRTEGLQGPRRHTLASSRVRMMCWTRHSAAAALSVWILSPSCSIWLRRSINNLIRADQI